MPEHRIRLRLAWDLIRDDAAAPARVDLPVVWAETDASGRFRLVRRFGRPRFDPSRDRVYLELADVPGLVGVRLNGVDLAVGPDGSGRIDLGRILLGRNRFELVGDPGDADRAAPWGTVALVIVQPGS